MTETPIEMLTTESGVNKEGEPFIHLVDATNKRTLAQFTPRDARAFALTVLETAEAAESDALLIAFLTGKLDVDPQRAAMVLIDFRHLRHAMAVLKPAPMGLTCLRT